jgi:hypothetical protein
MIKKEVRQFNKSYLDELLIRDNATLIGDYPKLHSGINIIFQCNCNNNYEKLFCSIAYYGGAYCKECTIKNKAIKYKKTCNKLYNVDNPSQLDEIKKKKEETSFKNYGGHPKRTKEVQDKYINTCLKKYNCINSAQSDDVKNKIKNTFNEKYNGHPMYNEEIKNKVKEIFNEKYNGHPMYNDEVKNKVKETCKSIYNGHPMNNDEVKNKLMEFFNKKYGCHPSQTPEVMEKIVKTSKSYKKFTMPSGAIRNIQGYEPFALNILLKEYNEEQIKSERKDMPIIKYTFNDISKRYFPDIYIPDKNLIIEVKSQYIYNKQLELNKVKEKFTKDAGYDYEVWIFDRKGNKL